MGFFPSLLPAAWDLSQSVPIVAGMPVPQLTEWGMMRLGAISFFIVVVLVSAGMVRWLWNVLAAGFPRLPRLTYGKALAAVILWGLLFVVVLTMIAGARELLTPGAWRRDGALYAIDSPSQAKPMDPQKTLVRKEHLERLKDALWQYAALHGGKFPAASDPAVAGLHWEVPGGAGMRYLYVAGRTASDTPQLVACEPALYGDERLALYTNGDIQIVLSAELRRQLDAGKKP